MATFTDLSELTEYEIPETGETIEINIAENYYGSYELYGSNIASFSAEDGNDVGEVFIGDNEYSFYGLLGEGESVTITFEVPKNIYHSVISFDIVYYDTEGNPLGDCMFFQEAGTSPFWEDGQHKIYRSGQQAMKMYRNGELIYLRLNPPTE